VFESTVLDNLRRENRLEEETKSEDKISTTIIITISIKIKSNIAPSPEYDEGKMIALSKKNSLWCLKFFHNKTISISGI